MIDITLWTDRYMMALKDAFGDRIWFAGIQGSYGRGEATEDSDIDMVVILDELTPQDIDAYDAMLNTLDHRELACGFLSGRSEIMRWEPSDLFQFCHDTRAWALWSTAETRRASAPGRAGGRRLFSCGWNWISRLLNRAKLSRLCDDGYEDKDTRRLCHRMALRKYRTIWVAA